ncbi:MAG: GFA family protein [Rhodovibrionaceae bacterium]
MELEGGCLCGAVRYRVEVKDGVVDYCHCRMCQRASGAPVVAWAQVTPAQFTVTRGTPKEYRSSKISSRHFCPDCGSQVFMSDPGGQSIGFTLGTLDEPEALRPTVHGWASAQLSWLHLTDELPRYDKAPPYDESEED